MIVSQSCNKGEKMFLFLFICAVIVTLVILALNLFLSRSVRKLTKLYDGRITDQFDDVNRTIEAIDEAMEINSNLIVNLEDSVTRSLEMTGQLRDVFEGHSQTEKCRITKNHALVTSIASRLDLLANMVNNEEIMKTMAILAGVQKDLHRISH